MMNKEIYDSFIEAEKEWENKIREVYNGFFSKFENDYKKMAELMIVVNDRLDNNLDSDKLDLYIELRWDLAVRKESNLKDDDYYDFCRLADDYCVQRIEVKD